MEDQDYLWFLLLLIPVLALIWCWCQGQKPAQPVQHKLAPVYVPQAPPVQLAPAPAPMYNLHYEQLGRPGDQLSREECEAFGVPYGTTYTGQAFVEDMDHPMPVSGYGVEQVTRAEMHGLHASGWAKLPAAPRAMHATAVQHVPSACTAHLPGADCLARTRPLVDPLARSRPLRTRWIPGPLDSRSPVRAGTRVGHPCAVIWARGRRPLCCAGF